VVSFTVGRQSCVGRSISCYAILAALGAARSAATLAMGGGTPLSDGPPFPIRRRRKGDAVAV